MTIALLVAVVLLAFVTAFYTGFHDASSAVSTTISTRSLRESTALNLAAVLNLLGALIGMMIVPLSVGWAVSLLGLGPIIEASAGTPDLIGIALVLMLIATLAWEIITWWYGTPSSTWHAFLGAALGASAALGAFEAWLPVIGLLALATLLGPLMGSLISIAGMRGLLALGRTERLKVGHLRFAQTVSACAVATGHGLSDSRLPYALVVLACQAAGFPLADSVWLLVPIAVAIAAGTLMGGHRIIRTIGRRLTSLNSAQGFVAECTSALLMALAVVGFQVPISSSHTLASSVVGAGAAMGPRHVRWTVAAKILGFWIATPVVTCVITAMGMRIALGAL